MKLDKETIVALIICMVFLMAWPSIQRKLWPPPPPAAVAPADVALDKAPPTSSTSKVVASTPKHEPSGVTADKSAKSIQSESDTSPKTDVPVVNLANIAKLSPVSLENDYIKATIDPNRAAVTSVVLKKYLAADKKQQVVLFGDSDPALLILPLSPVKWKVVSAELSTENKGEPTEVVSLKRVVGVGEDKTFIITQSWAIKEKYTIVSKVEISNPSDVSLDLGNLSISAGGIPTIHNQCGDKVPFRERHEIDYFNIESGKVVSIAAGSRAGFMAMISGKSKNAPKKTFTKKEDVPTKWVCVTNKYFTSILLPSQTFAKGLIAKTRVDKNKDDKEFIVAEASGIVDVGVIKPNATRSLSFECFTGPKKMKLLEAFDPETPNIMRLYIMGMVFLEPLSRLMLTALLWLKAFCGSYGLSIILLTLIVKTIFWPVTHKANMSMRKMQKIQPMIKELRKKYKDNPQQMNMEMMKLYKEYKVNPLGGCLPMLLQMPVFLALYATFSGTVEPRQVSFLWVHDLSLPDTVFTIPGLNLPIRPLMLMMTATMVLQQKLTPTAADPAQRKVMMFMPLIMLVMLYSLPAGLTLYWTVSQFISVAQLVVNKELERREELREAATS